MNQIIRDWAMRHCITNAALLELSQIMGTVGGHFAPKVGESESAVMAAVRLEAASKGVRLFRNNVGVLPDQRGVPVRFGLANESPAVNKVCKSADLIGWRPVAIGPQHVGTTLAQFVSRECKVPGWHYTGTEREQAQLAWASLVVASGGDACFATGTGTL